MTESPLALAPAAPTGALPVRLALASDERLARLLARGNEAAFRPLYDRYHQPLYRYCRSLLRQDADAQDALQSTFAAALTALRVGQRDAPMRPWLFRIAHNESISLIRRRRRRPEQELTDAATSRTASLEEQVEGRQRLALLVSDLRELPERQRGALVMREMSGLAHEEIALALDTSVNAAKQSIFEARRSLSEFAEGRAMACEEILRVISDADGRALRSRRVRAHLRHCAGCAAFAAAIPDRTAQLRALVPPLPSLVATGIFARAAGAGSSHGSHGAGLLAAGAGAGAKTTGMVIVAKAVTATVVAAAAAVGVTAAAVESISGSHRHRAVHAAPPAAARVAGRQGSTNRSRPAVIAPRGSRGGASPERSSKPHDRHRSAPATISGAAAVGVVPAGASAPPLRAIIQSAPGHLSPVAAGPEGGARVSGTRRAARAARPAHPGAPRTGTGTSRSAHRLPPSYGTRTVNGSRGGRRGAAGHATGLHGSPRGAGARNGASYSTAPSPGASSGRPPARPSPPARRPFMPPSPG